MRRSCSAHARLTLALVIGAGLIAPGDGLAQDPLSLAAERARLFELTRDSLFAPTDARISTSLTWLRSLAPLRVALASPTLRVTWNSDIPYSLNDGAQWAGRGVSLLGYGGVTLEQDVGFGVLRVRARPGVTYSRNRPFQVIASTDAGRSAFASPFHGPAASADVPHRFGVDPLVRLEPGASAAEFASRFFTVGFTTENASWGPGIRNQLVLSTNAAPIPRAFIRTSAPVRTRVGLIEVELIGGALTESLFFDADVSNDSRSFSAARVELRPAVDTTLSIGLERAVLAPVGSAFGGAASHALDALMLWRADSIAPGIGFDQLVALYGRWRFPDAGLEVYGEWARPTLPGSLAAVIGLGDPAAAFTMGLQWATPRSSAAYLRLQLEFTNLEQSGAPPGPTPPDFYSGRSVPQGYTQRGQTLGAAIGPGASSQWLAADYIRRRWQAGAYVSRIRWDNDALYRQPQANLFRHDVTLAVGVRGARRTSWADVALDLTYGYRYNYLFQNGMATLGGAGFRTVDVQNLTLALSISPP